MGAGVSKEGILQVNDTGGGGSSTSVAIGQPINATDAAVLNSAPVGTEYGVAVRLVGSSGGGGPATIANGADVNAGNTTDAAVITDTTGTLSGKLRGLVKWAFERMPASLGQKVMADSFPVVLASNQSTINTNATVAGTVAVSNFPATQAVTGPLTDVQLRATAVTVDIPTAVDINIIGAGVPLLVNTKGNLNVSAPTAVSVGTSSTAVVALNATRQGLVLVNTSNGIISLGFGTAAVLNSGITLLPYGSFCMDEYSFNIDAVNAIASVAASNLTVQEYTT
jgi:hypothetical protein